MNNDYILTKEQAKIAGITGKQAEKLIAENKARINNEIVEKLLENGSQTALRLLYGIINLNDPKEVYTGKNTMELETPDAKLVIECHPKDVENIDKL